MKKGEQTRRAVLDLAFEQAAAVGLEGLSIGELAKQMGMSKSGLFAHFKSKSALQVQVLSHAAQQFVDEIVRPALAAPRGEPRVRALFGLWLDWFSRQRWGCIFVAAVTELDDRPGPAREYLKGQQRDWFDVIETVARSAIDEGHFRADVDPAQFAYEMHAISLMLHLSARLLDDPLARTRADRSFEELLNRSRPN